MNIAVFADLHGRILLAFKLCARWEKETGEHIDLILQAGDLGAFPYMSRLDKATRRYASIDSSELGFMNDFVHYNNEVASALNTTTCNLLFVRGNHEDHLWLDALEQQATTPDFPVDAYQRVYNLRSGLPYTFHKGAETLTVLGVGRIASHAGEDEQLLKYIQPYEQKLLDALPATNFDVLLTHDAPLDLIYAQSGMEELNLLLDLYQPSYHFFGHYGGACKKGFYKNEVTYFCKLADLHWQHRGLNTLLEPGSMGILNWKNREEHRFEVVDAPWLKEYTAPTWRYL